MASVFISFIHEEERVAKAVKDLIEAKLNTATLPGEREKVFLSADEWQVLAGEIWLDRIREELDAAAVVILLLSAQSVERPWVNFEAGAAWLKGKTIIPACYGGLTKDQLPKPYSGIQALNLPDEAYYLFRSAFHRLSKDSRPGLAGIVPPPFSGDDKCVQELRHAISSLDGERRVK